MVDKVRGMKPRKEGIGQPVSVDEEVDVEIEAIGAKGDGIAKIKGYVVIVPEGQQGERYTVRITKVLPKIAFAEII